MRTSGRAEEVAEDVGIGDGARVVGVGVGVGKLAKGIGEVAVGCDPPIKPSPEAPK